MTALIVIFKLTLFAIVLFFVFRALVLRLVDFTLSDIKLAHWFAVWALVCILFGSAMSVIVRRLMLAPVWHPPGWAAMCAITWVSLMGKYVPGKFASLAGAVWMLGNYGVPRSVGLSVIFMIQGLSVVLGLIIAVPLTLWGPVYQRLPLAWLWCSLFVAIGVVCLHPKVFSTAANFLLRKTHRQPLQAMHGIRNYVFPLIIMFINQILIGTSLWFLARSVTEVSPIFVPFFISARALASTVGFLAVFAPAGVGVREGILLIVLSPVIGGGYAAIVVVAWRLLLTIVDVVLAGIGLLILRALRRKGAIIDGESG